MFLSKIQRAKTRKRAFLLASLSLGTTLVASSFDLASAHDWNRNAPMRALGIQPKSAPLALPAPISLPAPSPLAAPAPATAPAQVPLELQVPLALQAPLAAPTPLETNASIPNIAELPAPKSFPTPAAPLEPIRLASAGEESPTSVINAVATSAERQPSLVKVPAMKVATPVAQKQTPQDLETSRSIGAKVRLSAGSFVSSDSIASGIASLPSQTNSSNLKVTRSGDITAETPVKLSFSSDQVVAVPAFPSPNSPYAQTGIEIPVRVDDTVDAMANNLAQAIGSTTAPKIVPLPSLELAQGTDAVAAESPSSLPSQETSNGANDSAVGNTVDNTGSNTTDANDGAQSESDEAKVTADLVPPSPPQLVSLPSVPASLPSASGTIAPPTNAAAKGPLAVNIPTPTLPAVVVNVPIASITPPSSEPTASNPTTSNLTASEPTLSEPRVKAPMNVPVDAVKTVQPATNTIHPATNTVIAAPIMTSLPSVAPKVDAESQAAQGSQVSDSGIAMTTGPLVMTSGSSQNDVDRAEKMQIESQSMRALHVKGSISKIHIVDGSVCRVVANGSRLFLVGDQPGETVVEVTSDRSSKPTYVKVSVVKPWQVASKSSVGVDEIQGVISHLVPDAEIEVKPQADGTLIVKGMVDSNDQARKIIGSIRKMVLVPVVDALEVR
jgi:hypothetical protein